MQSKKFYYHRRETNFSLHMIRRFLQPILHRFKLFIIADKFPFSLFQLELHT